MNVTLDIKGLDFQFYFANPMELGPVVYQLVPGSNVMNFQKLKMVLLLKKTELTSMEMKRE